jgi:hypothetical protein
MQSNDKTEQTDVGKGYMGLSKENWQCKVSVDKMTVLPKLIEDTLNNKQFFK